MEQTSGDAKKSRLAELTKRIAKKRKEAKKKLANVEGEVKRNKASSRNEPVRRTRTVLEELERQSGDVEREEPAVEEAVVKKGVIRRRARKAEEAPEVAEPVAPVAEQQAQPEAAEQQDGSLFGAIRREAQRTGVDLEQGETVAEEPEAEAAPTEEVVAEAEAEPTEVEAAEEAPVEAEAEAAEAAEAVEAEEAPQTVQEAAEAQEQAEAQAREQAEQEPEAAPLVPDISPDELEAPPVPTAKPVQQTPAVSESGEPLIKRAGQDATPAHMRGKPTVEGIQEPPPPPSSPPKKRERRKKKGKVRELKEVAFSPSPHARRKRVVPKKQQQKTQITTPKAIKRKIEVDQAITVGDLAREMGIKAGEVMKKLMGMGVMVTINQTIDTDTAAIVASEFGYEVQNVAFDEEEVLEAKQPEDRPEDLKPRWPVVTVMGHVDHGKTSLLDAIRKTDVAGGEAGGITQHIGAYQVHLDDDRIVTFLDTPGHEAFTAMRARGAKVTDLVVLVVAADDGVMPQTIEAIDHSKAAGVPIIVAVNKIDKPNADPERVIAKLAEHELVPESWGGDTIFVQTSAVKGDGVDSVLEMILLQAELLELKANPDKPAKGAIVESKIDKGRGPVATVLVQEGTLHAGDVMVAGTQYGRIRALMDDHGNQIKEAGPSQPVEVLGLSGVADAGEVFTVAPDLDAAKQVVEYREQKAREAQIAQQGKVNLENLFGQIQSGDVKELNIVVKADVHGSIEAVTGALEKIESDEVKVKVIHGAVGAVNESDVMLAAASEAIIIGFNVRPDNRARELAEKEHIDIRTYSVIYNAVDDIKKAMAGMLEPKFKEVYLGRAEIRETFHISKVGTIAGCYVADGKITRKANVRLLRDNAIIYDGKLASLKRFKDDAKEVANGYECGMNIEGFNDIKVGDVIEAYTMEEVEATL